MGGRAKTLTKVISMRLTEEDKGKLDRLAGQIPIPPLTIARVALRLGLDVLLDDPTKILAKPIEKRGGARRRKKKGSK